MSENDYYTSARYQRNDAPIGIVTMEFACRCTASFRLWHPWDTNWIGTLHCTMHRAPNVRWFVEYSTDPDARQLLKDGAP